jgi:hypothetical protein
MKFLLYTLCFAIAGLLPAAGIPQKATHSIFISGRIKSEKKLEISELEKFKQQNIGDIVISNHKGEPKGTAKGLKGILLRDVLETVTLDTDNPKLFSEYYFACRASDGYKTVYSWNELFNTATGNTAYLVLEKEGKVMNDHDDAILMISSQDFRTGRRYIKNLETITVGRID